MSFTEPKSTVAVLPENLFLSSSQLLAAVGSPWLVATLLHPRAASFSHCLLLWVQLTSVQLLRRVRLFANPWTAACQASLSITNSQSPHKPMSIKLMMPSNHLILCRPLLLLPSIFPSIRVFSNESVLCIRWWKHWSFSFSSSPSSEYSGLISFWIDWFPGWW